MKKENIIILCSLVFFVLSIISLFIKVELEMHQRFLLILPILTFIIVVARNFIGLRTYSTFGPIILGLAFFQLGLIKALVLYVAILAFGIMINYLLKKLKILSVTLNSLTIAAVVLMLIFIIQVAKIDVLDSILLPFLVTAYMVDRFNEQAESKGYKDALILMAQTLIVALLAALIALMIFESLFLVTLLLLTISLTFASSLYTGVRLLEIHRFRKLIKE